MLHQPKTETDGVGIPNESQVEKFRERLRLIEARVQKQSQEEKLNQVRALLREEATQILLPALQDAMAQMTLQVLPDPRLTQSLEKTQAEVGRLATGMAKLTDAQIKADQSAREATERMASTMEAMFAATAEEVQAQQNKATEDLLREQRHLGRRQRFWTLASAGVVLLVMMGVGAGGLAWWRWDQRTRLGEQLSQLKEEVAQTESRLASQQAALAQVEQGRATALEEMEALRTEETLIRVQLKDAAETVTAITQARTRAQEDVRKLQQIQEANRFKLLPGNRGAVFVEIPAEAEPFLYQGKSYIKVAEAPST